MNQNDKIRFHNDLFEQTLYQAQIADFVRQAIKFVKGGKLFGYEIDAENPFEIVAALYCAYTTKEMLVDSQSKLNEFQKEFKRLMDV